MSEVDSCVDDARAHIFAAKLPALPGCGHLNVGHVPLRRVLRVIGCGTASINIYQEVWLTAGDICT